MMLNARAYRDLDDIFAYIALEKQSPENAHGMTDKIKKRLSELDTFPEAHPERSVGRYAGKGYRQLVIDNYVAIYRVEKEEKKVFIVTIQYERRNF